MKVYENLGARLKGSGLRDPEFGPDVALADFGCMVPRIQINPSSILFAAGHWNNGKHLLTCFFLRALVVLSKVPTWKGLMCADWDSTVL